MQEYLSFGIRTEKSVYLFLLVKIIHFAYLDA